MSDQNPQTMSVNSLRLALLVLYDRYVIKKGDNPFSPKSYQPIAESAFNLIDEWLKRFTNDVTIVSDIRPISEWRVTITRMPNSGQLEKCELLFECGDIQRGTYGHKIKVEVYRRTATFIVKQYHVFAIPMGMFTEVKEKEIER